MTMISSWRRCLVPLLVSSTAVKAFRPPQPGAHHLRSPSSLPLITRLSTDCLSRLSMSTATATSADVIPGRPTWHQTMLRIKDPKKSVAFYESLGLTLIDTFDFPQYKFSLYFMTSLPDGETYDSTPGTQAAHDYLWTMEGVALELTHNHGSETDDSSVSYHPGNQEKDGFGHIAVK